VFFFHSVVVMEIYREEPHYAQRSLIPYLTHRTSPSPCKDTFNFPRVTEPHNISSTPSHRTKNSLRSHHKASKPFAILRFSNDHHHNHHHHHHHQRTRASNPIPPPVALPPHHPNHTASIARTKPLHNTRDPPPPSLQQSCPTKSKN